MTIGHTAAPYVHIVMDDGLAHEIGAPEHAGPRRSEDNAASQVLTPGAVAGAAQSVGSAGESYELEVTTPLARILSHKTAPTADGSRPHCEKCGRGFYVCICNVPEPEPEYFKPAVRHDPDGWHRVEF